MPIGGEDMPRKAADAVAVDIVKVLTDAVERIAAEKVASQSEAVTQSIIEHLPEVIALPPPPAEVPLERLLSVKQVADLLGCSTGTVTKRFESGDLAFVLERGSENRKVPYSWVVEYIHSLPRYTGKLKEKKEERT
jgi:excisionase family DNA binding protein